MLRVVLMIAPKTTTKNGIPQLINTVVTLKTYHTSHLDNTQKEVC
jgi:hypothetical protein